jgi:serine/threonine protein kinase
MLNFIQPTESKTAATPYDGTKSDVYSAGVMLVVMLLHTMPWHYDTYAARLVRTANVLCKLEWKLL